MRQPEVGGHSSYQLQWWSTIRSGSKVRKENAWSPGVVRGPSADGAPSRTVTVKVVARGRTFLGRRAIQRSSSARSARILALGSAATSSAVASRRAQV